MLNDRVDALPYSCGYLGGFGHSRFTDSAFGLVDYPAQTDVVVWIVDDLQIRRHVLDLFTVIKAMTAYDPVRNGRA